jgi:hypothetical protein
VAPFTETYNFRCDEATDTELADLPLSELISRLLAARGAVDGEIVETDRGWWGDMRFMSYQPPIPGPTKNWNHVGSPAWLNEFFPNWNEPTASNAEPVKSEAPPLDDGGAP